MKIIEWIIITIIVVVLGLLAIPNYYICGGSNLARTESELRSLKNALESFYIDNKSYPVMFDDSLQPNTSCENSINHVYFMVEDERMYLTTPVAYMSSLPRDVFRDINSNCGFGYGSNGQSYYILTSYGPDKVDGIGGIISGELNEREYTGAQFSDIKQAGVRGAKFTLSDFRFDPSNGVNSAGDIIMIGPTAISYK